MTADPRVEVVARALLDVSEAWPRTGDALDDAYLARKYARAAVAALDEHYRSKGPITFSAGAGEHITEAIGKRIEADLRERIAREIEADACRKCVKAGRQLRGRIHEPCGYWLAAARIARGES